jgi:aspartate aminotransferase-like enzyme
MEEAEIPTEHLQEAIHERAEEAKDRWTLLVALSTAVMAVLAAIAGLLSGHQVNEALIDQIRASDQWSYYQAKGIKLEVATSTQKILHALPGAAVASESSEDAKRYEKEKEDIKVKAEEHEKTSEKHLSIHVTLSKAVTIFQIAIAIAAISILTKRRGLWYGSIALTLIGIFFLVTGILM